MNKKKREKSFQEELGIVEENHRTTFTQTWCVCFESIISVCIGRLCATLDVVCCVLLLFYKYSFKYKYLPAILYSRMQMFYRHKHKLKIIIKNIPNRRVFLVHDPQLIHFAFRCANASLFSGVCLFFPFILIYYFLFQFLLVFRFYCWFHFCIIRSNRELYIF